MRPSPLPRRLLLVAAALLALLAPGLASALGTAKLVGTDLTEVEGRWKLNMTIDYGSIPQLPHIPMIFSFTPTVLYERALLDKTGDKPQINKIQLKNQQGIHESIDVGFSDASGKVFKVTKFDFVIRRDHGFEAGEYDLKIKREDDGVQMGQTIKLILKGDNPIVDRRAITFAGEKKSKKVDADKPAEKKDDAPKEAPKDDGAPKENPQDEPKGDAAPPPVPPKQGGCGCRTAGAPESAGAPLAALALGIAVMARRRRRRAA